MEFPPKRSHDGTLVRAKRMPRLGVSRFVLGDETARP
jgi:hypothetical protein